MKEISDTQPRVDVSFRLSGKLVPQDHGHALFGALGSVLGDIHNAHWLSVHPILGTPRPDSTLSLSHHRGALRLRVRDDSIAKVLPLAGKRLEINGYPVMVGVSTVALLSPAASLMSRLVVIMGCQEADPIREAVARQLFALGVKARTEVGQRRVLRISGTTVVGYQVTLHDLDEEGSMRVQYSGLGGKQLMGCGVFVRLGPRHDTYHSPCKKSAQGSDPLS